MIHKKYNRCCTLALLSFLLAGCSSSGTVEEQPEIDSSVNGYKRSPCACLPVEQSYPPGWTQEWLGSGWQG